MFIELFEREKGKKSLIQKFLETIGEIRNAEDADEKEFFNADKSRKWVFYKWKWGDNEESGQLNAALCVQVGDSWTSLMKGMMRWEPEKEIEYGLEISGINVNRNESIYWYDASTGGKKRWSGIQTRNISQGLSTDEVVNMLHQAGVKDEDDLPEFVDFASTINLFMIQAKNLDFSNPQIVEKKLIR